MEKDDSAKILSLLIKELNVPVTRTTIYDEFQRHPNPTSLLAMSDLLNNWGVPNSACSFTFEELMAMPVYPPFIANTTRRGFVVVNHLTDQSAVISGVRHQNKKIKIEKFKKLYTGSVLLVEKDELSGEVDYKKKRRREFVQSLRTPFIITGTAVILIICLLSYSSFLAVLNWHFAMLGLFKTLGLIIGILLLIQGFDNNNPLINKLCIGGGVGCDTILSSKAAKLTDELSWSEVGFFYFAGTWLMLIFNSRHTGLMQTLALLNIISLPYTFYSIYYQWHFARQWCVLCCTVQALLWLEFVAFLPYLTQPLQVPDLTEWGSLTIGLTAPVLAWTFFKPYLLQSKQLRPIKQQLRKFKYNSELFAKMLNESPQYVLPELQDSLIFGNPEAEKVVTMVTNPYCQPCARAHKGLQWLNERNDIKLQIIFSLLPDPNYKNTAVAAHLLSLQQDQGGIVVKKAVDDWYEQQSSYESWAKVYPTKKSGDFEHQLQKQLDWCSAARVNGTPAIFINGRRLSNNYQPEDLKYFI